MIHHLTSIIIALTTASYFQKIKFTWCIFRPITEMQLGIGKVVKTVYNRGMERGVEKETKNKKDRNLVEKGANL